MGVKTHTVREGCRRAFPLAAFVREIVKKLSRRMIAMLTNGVLAAVLILVGCVCFFPASKNVSSALEGRVIRSGSSRDGVSLMFNVYWGTEEVDGILSVLEEYGAAATFFVGGSWADDNAACLRRIAAAGHEIGSHGYFHRDHTTLGYEGNVEEIARSVQFLSLVTGEGVTLFAPPSGAYDEDTVSAAESLGLKTILWTKDTVDWRDKDAQVCFSRATQDVAAGDFVLMHPMAHTLEALPRILERYAALGLRAVTVGENLSA